MNWEDAEKHCQGEGGHLASVHSAEENNFLTGMTKQMHWLGATNLADVAVWVWSDGTAWDFTDWKANQPDNKDREKCLMRNWSGIQWNNGKCDALMFKYHVCKFAL